jgi:excisionase family DNA binding protein
VNGLTLNVPAELVEEIVALVEARMVERLDDDGYVGVKGAAEFLDCGVDRIYALCSAKRIPHHKDGSRTLFCKAELREYIRNGGARRP